MVVVCAVFSRGLLNDFVQWDDDINIYKNPHVQGLDAGRVKWMFTDIGWVRYYAPLAWLSVAVIHEFSGLDPFGYHLASLLLHCANSVLLYWLIRMLVREHLGSRLTPGQELKFSICCAAGVLFWALHPLRVEAVAWATGLSNSQALFFALLALLAYLRSRHPMQQPARRFGWYWAAVVCYLASLLTYPITLGLVVVIPLLDVYPLRRFKAAGGFLNAAAGRIWAEKLPFVAVAMAVLAFTVYRRFAVGGIWAAPLTLEQFSLTERIMQAFYVWACYLWRTALPFDLSPVYTSLMWFKPFSAPFVLSALLVLGLTGLLLWRRHTWPGLTTLWLAYLIILVPVLGWTEHPHYPNDRYSLIAGAAWSFLLTGVLFALWERVQFRGRLLACTTGVLSLFALITIVQIGFWRDTETLFTRTLSKLGGHRYACDIHWRLGQWMLEKNRLEDAAQQFQAAANIDSNYALPCDGLGQVREKQGRWAEALEWYRNAIRINPGLGRTQNQIAWLLATAGDPAVRNGAEALSIAQQLAARGGANAPEVLRTVAAARAESGDYANAARDANRALSLARLTKDDGLAASLEKELALYKSGRPFHQSAP